MKIGILSDTHDQVARTSRAISTLIDAGAEAIVHCGDITGRAVVLEFIGVTSLFVFGNNDFDHDELRRAVLGIGGTCLGRGATVELDGKQIAVCHGDSAREVRRLMGSNPDYFLFGHSHVATDDRRDSTRWINPGALHRADTYTVAVLDLQSDHLEFLTIT